MRDLLAVAFVALLAVPLPAQSSCKVEGVWQLVSGSADGKPYPAGLRELKIITKGHFAVLWQEPGVPKALESPADSLAAYRYMGAGGGTYTKAARRSAIRSWRKSGSASSSSCLTISELDGRAEDGAGFARA